MPKTKTSTRSQTKSAERPVQDFLSLLSKALTSGDGNAAAELWETPAYVIGDDMVKVINTGEEVAEFFSGAKGEYNKQGIVDTRPEIQKLEWLTERIAVTTVRWPYLDDKGKEIGAEKSTYTLREDDDGELKFCVAVMQGVESASQAKGPKPRD